MIQPNTFCFMDFLTLSSNTFGWNYTHKDQMSSTFFQMKKVLKRKSKIDGNIEELLLWLLNCIHFSPNMLWVYLTQTRLPKFISSQPPSRPKDVNIIFIFFLLFSENKYNHHSLEGRTKGMFSHVLGRQFLENALGLKKSIVQFTGTSHHLFTRHYYVEWSRSRFQKRRHFKTPWILKKRDSL
jgi:hypothetical protein